MVVVAEDAHELLSTTHASPKRLIRQEQLPSNLKKLTI